MHLSDMDNVALPRAAVNGDTRTVQALLASGIDVNTKYLGGWTAIALAAQKGHVETVLALLAAEADINAQAQTGATALMVAAQNGHRQIVQDLLEAGADVNAKMLNGATALLLAAQQGHNEIVQSLLDCRADLNAETQDGWTALMAASQMGHAGIVGALLSRGADVNAKERDGRTALMIAAERGEAEVVELLRSKENNAESGLPGQERNPLISKVSLFVEPLPTFSLGEDVFMSTVHVNPPNTLIESADEALDLDGELIAHVNRRPIELTKIRLMTNKERQEFFEKTSVSTQWATFLGSTPMGLRYNVLVEFDVVQLALRNLQRNLGLSREDLDSIGNSHLKKATTENEQILPGAVDDQPPDVSAAPEIEKLVKHVSANKHYYETKEAWADLENLPNREAAIEPLMRAFHRQSAINGNALCKFLGGVGSEACRKSLFEILDYARQSSDTWDQKYLIGAACTNLLKLPGGLTAIRETVTFDLFRFIIARALISVKDEERVQIVALVAEDERQDIIFDLIAFFRSVENKDDWVSGISGALWSLSDLAIQPLLEIFRTVKRTIIEDDGSAGIEGEDGPPASALVRIPGGIEKLKSVCLSDEYESILVIAHKYDDSANSSLNRALGEIASPKAIGRLLFVLQQSRWAEESRKPAREALVKAGKKAHSELLRALAWSVPTDRKFQTSLRKQILDVLKETGDEDCVLKIRIVMADPLVATEAGAAIEAIQQRCGDIKVPDAVQESLPLRTIARTGDVYVDSCFQIDFQVFYESRDWFKMPEAKAIPTAETTQEAFRLAEKLREEYPDFDFSYYWLSILYRRQRRDDEARNILVAGLRAAKSKSGLCECMAETEWQAGNLPEAVKWWIKSIVVQIGAGNIDDYVPFLHLSYVAEQLGLFNASMRLKEYVDNIRTGRIRVTDEAANEFYTATRNQGTDSMKWAVSLLDTAYLQPESSYRDLFLSLVTRSFSTSSEAVRSALSLVLQSKGLKAEYEAESRVTQRSILLAEKYPEVATKLKMIGTLRTKIAEKNLASAGREGLQAHRLFLAKWHAAKERLEKEVAREVRELDVERKLRSVDSQVLAMTLPAGAVLIEFIRFDDFDFETSSGRGETQWQPARYLAFVIAAGEPDNIKMIDLGEADPIDNMIATFRSIITGEVEHRSQRGLGALPGAEQRVIQENVGIQLREAVFTPLVKALGNCMRLLISPDGDLTRLPFEVLPIDEEQCLIDRYHISYLAAGRDVVRFDFKSDREPGKSLVVADPDFDFDAQLMHDEDTTPGGCRSRDFTRDSVAAFNRLPNTRLEGESVAAMLGAELWTGSRALDALLKKCHSPRVLHVSTHGFFLEDQRRAPNQEHFPFSSMISSVSGMERFGTSRFENPLLRSGLALAGVNTWLEKGELMEGAEDGLLTAEDVSGLDLLDTELVVLSACDTGLGVVRVGEGVFGLRSAFVLAGAKTLVMSLWKVPDEQTRELMEDFYCRILGTARGHPQSRADALRAAQLAMKAKHPEPLYWGAFICQGDPEPLL